tara:strand:+ start:5569 stop:9531 length:3963 start_codon:yes stop_codon:yes gene_type:complete
MFFYSSVPLVDKDKCPKASDHNKLAKEFNKRLLGPGPACAWNIFYYADSIFLGQRNTATPGQPLGTSPPEDEWWKVYYNIELPTAETGEGNWPLALAGTPQGANVMNPLNAYIFGRVTAENKKIEKMGPWAEGNLFDGLVETSRAVHSNSVFWSSSFRQRGAFLPSSNYSKKKRSEWRKGSERYLPSEHDPVLFSKSLFWVGRSSDHYFPEYASQHVYMRYPPSVYRGSYVDKYTGERKTPSLGILKRKNAAKDLLQWALWAYTFYFKGNEQQRSLFCEKKTWDAPVINFVKEAGDRYRGEQVYGERSVRTSGPLNICKVGFDFYSYYIRQNILAPVLGVKVKKQTSGASSIATDDMGYASIEQYRPVLKFEIESGSSADNWLGKVNGKATETSPLENYDGPTRTTSESSYHVGGGKTLRFRSNKGYKDDGSAADNPDDDLLFKFSSDDLSSKNDSKTLKLGNLLNEKQKRRRAVPCLAGYYLQTNGLTNDDMKFVLRIWQNTKVIHETLIHRKYSYKINRSSAKGAAYVYNKLFYFKKPVSTGNIEFEIVPFTKDGPPVKGVFPTEGDFQAGLTETAYKTYSKAYENQGNKPDTIIAFGNPYSNSIDTTFDKMSYVSSGSPSTTEFKVFDGGSDNDGNLKASYLEIHQDISLSTGDMVKILRYEDDGTKVKDYAQGGRILFVNKESQDRLYLSNRRDASLKEKDPDAKFINRYFDIYTYAKKGDTDQGYKIQIIKMNDSDKFVTITLEPAILLKQRPTFQDAYSLLRVTTAKKAGDSNSLLAMAGFDPEGADQAGHGFYESNKVFKNYIKYGSAANINGAEAVKALRQKVSYNPIYESARKFISSYLRVADRIHLINYRVEGGKGVLYFRRFNPNLPKKAKSTIFDNMEPPLDPSGRFHDSLGVSIDNLPSTRYKPIIAGQRYYVHIPEEGAKIKYNGIEYGHGQRFTGHANSTFLESTSSINIDTAPPEVGAYEINSIRESAPYGYESNEWVMFMNSVHYKNGGIYKPSIYSDIMGFLNNRCHHRSKEYEQTYGEKYDMIREELMRTPTLTNKSRFSPGRRLQIFLSKSSNNYNYVFNTNNPSDGNLDSYGVEDYVKKYRASCPPVSQKPYKVKKCTLVHPLSRKDLEISTINPSYKKSKGVFGSILPANIIRVELDRPLSNTGRLSVGSKGYSGVDLETLIEEPYRTDENAVIEYLFHKNTNYNCKRMMLGDYGTSTEVHEGYGYRPQGACYPRFYFLKLIPKVGKNALLDSSPYAQMDFYFRAIAGEFVDPFFKRFEGSPEQVGSANWKFSELASRSIEEDPTSYYYVDPREISGR